MTASKIRITLDDVCNAIRIIYRDGYKFGQNFIYIRGKPKNGTLGSASQSGIEEKINCLLSDTPTNIDVNLPTCSASKVLQEGHHSMMALTIIRQKRLTNDGIIRPESGGGSMFVSQKYINIIDGNMVYKFDTLTKAVGQGKHYANIGEALLMKDNQ